MRTSRTRPFGVPALAGSLRPRPSSFVLVLACCLSLSQGAEWDAGNGFRSTSLTVPTTGKTGFTLLEGAATGIHFTNVLSMPRQLRSHVLLNGSGVATGDMDGDGWCDLYFCGLDGPNVLYKNLGNWKFRDVTAEAGVTCAELDATGAAFADLDGDADLDLIVNSTAGGTYIFMNDGKGRFQTTARLNPGKGGTSLALADIDGDGYLDLYVANYRTTMLVDMPQTNFRFTQANGKKVLATVNGRPVTDPELADRFVVNAMGGVDEQGEMDVLYRNLGGTNFVVVPFLGGAFLDEDGRPLAEKPLDWGLSVMFRDINGDSLPDLYVCNDFDSPDRMWINISSPLNPNLNLNPTPLFRAVHPLALRKLSLFSMGVDFADINRDGYDDFFVLDMLSRDHVRRLTQMPDRKPPVPVIGQFQNRPQYTMNTLFLNQGDGTYTEIAQLAGVAASEWSWTPVFLDVDLDGWEDLLIANGHARDARNLDVLDRLQALRTQRKMSNDEILEARSIFPRLAVAKLAFRNRHDLTFEEVGNQWGFDTVSVAHGMATADLDNDGDLDVIVNNLNGPAGIYRNGSTASRLAVRLKGQKPNTAGIGAKIKVTPSPLNLDPLPLQSQEIICGGRYLSSDQPMRTFAAGSSTNFNIEVTWRNGTRSIVNGAKPNRLYEIEEVQHSDAKLSATKTNAALFQDVSHLINHSHHDDPFDDYARQPLLPKKLSQFGPGISWGDVDRDGWDDLIIGSGKGGQMAIYRNDGRGALKRMEGALLNQPFNRDQTTILILPIRARPSSSSSFSTLLAGSSSYEQGSTSEAAVLAYDLSIGKADDLIPTQQSSPGALALADLDNDGDLDLFVGGRVIPGKYPEPASSLVLRTSDGKFEIDRENTKAFAGVGLVTAAVFSDIDSNGAPDLILTCEWGPIKIFRNQNGHLTPWNAPLTLNPNLNLNPAISTISQLTGWWNGVTTADFDGDGRLDIIASNWGQNTPYQSHRTGPSSSSSPLVLVYGDLDENGTEDMIEGYYDPPLNSLVSKRMASFVGAWLPFVGERFDTYEAFARASIQQICGPQWKNARQLQVNWLESTLFLNRGDKFEVLPLPVEAQMAPAFAGCAADFDGDGHHDVFLSQNFFAAQPDTPRYDGGRGLLFRGNGSGGFTAVSGQDSGITIYGEQRGAAISDWDGDGRIDLAVGQNGSETKLYKNVAAKPGLRVRLIGLPENPDAIGAVLRLGASASSSTSDSKPQITWGPAQEIHAGSGYWSQDSPVQVLTRSSSSAIDQLWIRWPGGKVTTAKVPPDAREISIDAAGDIRILR